MIERQRERFAALDPMLPAPPPPPDGDVLTAATADGERLLAVHRTVRHAPGSTELLWSPAVLHQLYPYPGGAGLDPLLRAWRAHLRDERPDSGCLVVWPSRDVGAARDLLAHGLLPLSVLAVRSPAPGQGSTGVTVRRVGPGDRDTVAELATATFDYTGQVGAPRHPDTPTLVRCSLDGGGPRWLAERDGRAVGLADCAWTDVPEGSDLLPVGRWFYVNTVGTTPDSRGTGVGRALMAAAHDHAAAGGATGCHLYYNPANPLAPAFWHRQGYRPLWTLWEVRPASALR
ncbi:GNAT family N-acetyltransferase [Amycolatopsis suaedae]|uniref:N-acetyltransferase n=1 Tax=Amycolatopsis suaedae TaxID=2510978 RepID=A0A4Q7J865_9PSEU|nr:GNAT family N-acetyltransferase [Amycolatopsis suaedae]RZQ63012.1 N-acetyltransferase [Amycolatopsis suaedae]